MPKLANHIRVRLLGKHLPTQLQSPYKVVVPKPGAGAKIIPL